MGIDAHLTATIQGRRYESGWVVTECTDRIRSSSNLSLWRIETIRIHCRHRFERNFALEMHSVVIHQRVRSLRIQRHICPDTPENIYRCRPPPSCMF